MTNEKIGDIYAKPQKNYISFNEALNLARQDEREKLQTEIGHLEYKIEGLQQALSRNKDEREKMQGVDVSKMSEILRSNSKETWIAAKGSDEGWNTWWKKRNQLNTN